MKHREDSPRARREAKEARQGGATGGAAPAATGAAPTVPPPRRPATSIAASNERAAAFGRNFTEKAAAAQQLTRNMVNAQLVVTEMQSTYRELKPLVDQGSQMVAEFRELVNELRGMLGPLADPEKMAQFSDLLGKGAPLPVALAQVLGAGSTEATNPRE